MDDRDNNIYRNPLGQGYSGSQTTQTKAPKSVSASTLIETLNNIWRGLVKLLKTDGVAIEQLPLHLYPPFGSRTIDFKKLVTVPAQTLVPTLLWEYPVKDGFYLRITHYAIFNDGLYGDEAYFIPSVDNQRILNFHGDPTQNFLLYLGNTADLSGLASANILLRRGQTLRWQVVNKSVVGADMGARMIGYLDPSKKQAETRFGG